MMAQSPFDSNDETVTQLVANGPPTAGAQGGLPTIPGYMLVRRLGGGGMGDVYEVIDERLGVPLALKIVRLDRVSSSFTQRFRQEIRAMMSLEHPRIARIYANNEIEGRPYFTMKLVRGGTLADLQLTYRSRPREAITLMLKVIDAVAYVHQQGRVHRDLKPSNILLDEAGEPFLSDFGLVKDLGSEPSDLVHDPSPTSPAMADLTPDDEETRTGAQPAGGGSLTKTGARLGTYAYMSPEQARGDIRRIGPASDIWALGVIIHELVTGARPEPGSTDKGLAGVDPALGRIIVKCMSVDPLTRYTTAGDLATDLRAWLDRPRVRARRRWLAATAIVVLLGAATIYAAVNWPRLKSEPEDPVQKWRDWARAEIQANRPVTLVDGEGNAPGAKFIVGEPASKFGRDADGWWAVHSTDVALIEFLSDPGIDDFTLSAEIRPINPAYLPEAGFFVAHRRIEAAGGPWHVQVEYVYEENVMNFDAPPQAGQPPPPPPNAIVLKADKVEVIGNKPRREVRARACNFAGTGNVTADLYQQAIGQDARVLGGPWRQLAIRARPDGYAVNWGEQPPLAVPKISANDLNRMQSVLNPRPDPPLEFTARGGLGVYLENGSAAYRYVVLTPHHKP